MLADLVTLEDGGRELSTAGMTPLETGWCAEGRDGASS